MGKNNNVEEQLTIFDIEPDWRKEWQDMPEFVRHDNRPYQRIIVNFKNIDDVREFGKLINQRLTKDTDTIWFPPHKTPTGIYIDEP